MDFDEGSIPCLSLSNPTQYAAYLSQFIPRVLDDIAHHPSSYHHRYWTSSHNAQVCTNIGTGRCRTTLRLIGMPSTTIGAWCRRTTPLVAYSCPWDNPVVPSRNPPRQCSKNERGTREQQGSPPSPECQKEEDHSGLHEPCPIFPPPPLFCLSVLLGNVRMVENVQDKSITFQT
ncbi:hypothetical protein Cgig2_025565 [Carnegiea gigantea]|uniref:Uncharacterized protein n=1 Tax=Carnegiea gigantea TaxID=171969 RepID=A0A9Q1JL07_9CARY|nr:hypothetical protein Cgig2_025565 [Carnegiea gigantea]